MKIGQLDSYIVERSGSQSCGEIVIHKSVKRPWFKKVWKIVVHQDLQGGANIMIVRDEYFQRSLKILKNV